MPKVSVIIPVYNAEKTLRECLDSVVKQTFNDIEIICVDDGSTDDSYNILIEYATKDSRFKIFKQINSGPSKARNLGWDVARSGFIAFLDSDDVWHDKKLELQYAYMLNNKNIYFSCHGKEVIKLKDMEEFYKSEKEINRVTQMKAHRLLFKHYSNGATSSFMLRNIDDIRFDIRKKRSEDYLLSLKILFRYSGVCIDTNLSASFKETYGDAGLSKDLWKMEKGDLDTFNILRNDGYINIITCFFCSIFSIIKYIRRYVLILFRNKG